MVRREHKERSQPSYRAHMGLLEKHKDYSARATDFNKKKGAIKSLKRKALERNPDEFNTRMIKSRTKVHSAVLAIVSCVVFEFHVAVWRLQDGVHVLTRPDNMTGDLFKVLKTQDLGYVQTVMNCEEKVLYDVLFVLVWCHWQCHLCKRWFVVVLHLLTHGRPLVAILQLFALHFHDYNALLCLCNY